MLMTAFASVPMTRRRSRGATAPTRRCILLALSTLTFVATFMLDAQPARQRLLFDRGWKFRLGDAAEAAKDLGYGSGAQFAKAGEATGPVNPSYDDRAWRDIELPHDWAVELGFVQVNDDDVRSHGYKPIGRQFPSTSIGWYRRAFAVEPMSAGKRIRVSFDGVFRDCTVWINGHYIGRNLSGYSGFGFDVTDYLRAGTKNVIVVRVDATHYEGWFYEGAGIYRHAWLEIYDPLHVAVDGVFVHAAVDAGSARVTVETEILNERDSAAACTVTAQVESNDGRRVAAAPAAELTFAPGKASTAVQVVELAQARLWTLDDPYRYRLVTEVRRGGALVDRVVTRFGIRSVRFDKDRGFFLNETPTKILGVCCHQDHAGVGSALPDGLQYFRIGRLKEMGANAYRTSHNPPTPELLEACDSLGMLVMDENRLPGSAPELLGQFEGLIRRDRNHPSVILWSLGNEEYLIQNNDVGKNIARTLLRRQRELDPTRFSTYGGNNGNQYDGINSEVPVRGFNYMSVGDIDKYRADHPEQILIGSEEASTLCTRGVFADDTARGYLCDYDINKPSWGATAEGWWTFYDARPWLAGAFVWTGFDYRGEPTPYSWPCISSHFGIMDVCGYPKTNYFYYQSWWSKKDVLHLAPHWNWRAGDTVNVWCESNCDIVELLLNGRSLGTKSMPKNSHLEWRVPYEPGMLEARGTRAGKPLRTVVATAGKAAKLLVTADRASINADGEEIAVVTVTALDDRRREVPTAGNLIRFQLAGEATIIGVGNGDPSSHEPDKCPEGAWERRLFNGKCQLIIRAGRTKGRITLQASADGLQDGRLSLTAMACEPRPAVPPYEQARVAHLARGAAVAYVSPFNPRYSAGGASGLVDGVLGSADFKDGFWQGFEKNPMVATIDLGGAKPVSSIATECLNDIDSWIFLPKDVLFETSLDGRTYEPAGRVVNDVPADSWEKQIRKFAVSFSSRQARYVRVTAASIGTCPPWHKGAGGGAWIFIDEILVN